MVFVKLIAEYLERAHQFERLASNEADPKLKADFEKQALAYHKLAGKRAKELGLPQPTEKPGSKAADPEDVRTEVSKPKTKPGFCGPSPGTSLPRSRR